MINKTKAMENLTITIAANISYSGVTYNTPTILELKHTGEYYFLNTKKGRHILSDIESARDTQAKGQKVLKSTGYYFIKRIAVPTIGANMDKCNWYINNPGDTYSVNKVSKYGRKIYAQLATETISPLI
jgi:hypothetical protein